MPEIKRVTLHPLKPDGSVDTNVNLYPKTLIDGIVDRDGEQVEVQEKLVSGENIKSINGKSIVGEGNIEISGGLEKVESEEEIPDNELGLYKYPEYNPETGDDRSSHIVEVTKEEHAASQAEFFKTTTSNNQDVSNIDNLMNQFDSQLGHFIEIWDAEKAFTLYFAPVEEGDIDEAVSGIRLGTSKVSGRIGIILKQRGTLYFKQYFSYNASTGEVIGYDANSTIRISNSSTGEVIEEFPLNEDDWSRNYSIELDAGTYDIDQIGGRVIFMGFSFDSEPYSTYTHHELARVEEVEAVQEELDSHVAQSEARFSADENAIQQNANEIVSTNNKIGPIQIYEVKHNLPPAGEEFLDKVFRFKEKFYQCVKKGEGVHKEWAYNVTGTSEITLNTYMAFAHEVGSEYEDYITSVDTENLSLQAGKLFRNNGSIKLGSSGSNGWIALINKQDYETLPITSFKVGLRAYNYGTTKTTKSAVHIENNTSTFLTDILLEPDVEETIIEIPYNGERLDPVDIESISQYDNGEETITCDKRAIITRIIVDFGATEYVWKEISGGSSTGASNKTILFEMMPSELQYLPWDDEDKVGHFKGKLRLRLINFNDSDVGSYLFLYNKAKSRRGKKYIEEIGDNRSYRIRSTFKHPENYDSQKTNIRKLGFGVIAGKKVMSDVTRYTSVPTWMPHNGYVQTEYEITQEHIEQGYMDIDIGKEFLSLLAPKVEDANLVDEQYIFKDLVTIYGDGTQWITFYQIKDGQIACVSQNVLLCRMSHARERSEFNKVVRSTNSEGTEKRLTTALDIRIHY